MNTKRRKAILIRDTNGNVWHRDNLAAWLKAMERKSPNA